MAIKATLKKTGKAPAPKEAAVVDVEATQVETNLEQAVAGETAQEGSAAPATPQTQAVATRPKTDTRVAPTARTESNIDGVTGDWGSLPSKFPQLKIVQGSGKLAKEWNIGTVIFNDMELFPPVNKAKKETPRQVRVIPVNIDLQFRRKLTQDEVAEGVRAEIVNSVAEVEEAGGTTRWYGDTMPDNYWEPSGRCLFLIEQPAGIAHPSFALDLDGKAYGVGLYYGAGMAFNACPKLIVDTSKTSLYVPVIGADGQPVLNGKVPVKKILLYKCVWTLAWDTITTKSGFTPYRPICRLTKDETGPEVRAYCANVLSTAEARAVAAAADEE